jgi:protein-tyrosine phosphatase
LFLDILWPGEGKAIPDPYYGGTDGFETVIDLCEQGAKAWVAKLQ